MRLSGSVSGAQPSHVCSPRSNPFPPQTPPTSRLCSLASLGLWVRPTPQLRPCRHYGLTFAGRSARHRADRSGVSRFSSMKLHLRRVPVTPPDPTATRLLRRSRFRHSFGTTEAASGNRFFRSSIARLALLRSTLRQPLTRARPMTRGRSGWLTLPRTALSSAVSCRFIPTLSVPPSFRTRSRPYHPI